MARWFALGACASACAGKPSAEPFPAVAANPSASVDGQPSAPESAAPPKKEDVSSPLAASAEMPSATAGAGATETNAAAPTNTVSSCPSGMLHVKFDFCPKVTRRCLDKEYDKPNHITICYKYAAEKPKCEAERVPLDFCIDEYEYPNRAGAKPPVMVNFFEASAQCEAEHERLCTESEWMTACEGPEEKPFPYGYERSSKRCNFDNRWVDPKLSLVYAKDPELQRAELARLDRSVPSGQMAGCVSDFGVRDLTGNVDEWVRADHERPREKAKFSALKGGAWGHVRNACRPVTTSHVPQFRYYFIGFRCCADSAR